MVRPSARRRIGKNLRRQRLLISPQLDQASIAKLLGVSRTIISRIENGNASLRAEDIVILVEKAGLDLDGLLEGCPIGY